MGEMIHRKAFMAHALLLSAILVLSIWQTSAWSLERKSMLSMPSILLPGSGQFLTGHPVKGLAFALAEGVTLGMAFNEDQTYTQWYQSEWNRLQDSVGGLTQTIAVMASDTALDSIGNVRLGQLRTDLDNVQYQTALAEGRFRNSTQLRNMELLWAGGVYVYNLMDVFEKGMFERNDSPKTPWTAVLLSAFLPGAGQVYNGAISKAGMVWMTQSALVVSALYRHDLMRYYERQIGELGQANATATVIETRRGELENGRNDARRRRNSFIWYSLGFYFYNVFDALVDAHLHDFDRHPEIAIIPGPDGMRIAGVFPIRGGKRK